MQARTCLEPRCPECDYDLRGARPRAGTGMVTCPECGARARLRDLRADHAPVPLGLLFSVALGPPLIIMLVVFAFLLDPWLMLDCAGAVFGLMRLSFVVIPAHAALVAVLARRRDPGSRRAAWAEIATWVVMVVIVDGLAVGCIGFLTTQAIAAV